MEMDFEETFFDVAEISESEIENTPSANALAL